jgi:hypothetical protein
MPRVILLLRDISPRIQMHIVYAKEQVYVLIVRGQAE